MRVPSASSSGSLDFRVTHRLVWRIASVLVFCGVPVLLLVMIGLNISGALEETGAAARSAESATTIGRQLDRFKSRTQDATDISALYLASATGSLARAEIQNLTSHLVEAASGHLLEAQIIDNAASGDPGKVSIQLTLDITNPGLLDLLYAVETNLPLLTVTDLDARTAEISNERPGDNGLLHVDMTIQGYWRSKTP